MCMGSQDEQVKTSEVVQVAVEGVDHRFGEKAVIKRDGLSQPIPFGS